MVLRELFGPLLGNWTGIEEQAASPWAAAASARAMITFKVDVADQVVLQDYRQVRSDGAEFSAHGVFMALRQAQGASVQAQGASVQAQGQSVQAQGASVQAESASTEAQGAPGGAVGWWLFDSYGEPPERAMGGWLDGELVLRKTTPSGVAEHRFSASDNQLDYLIRVRLGEQVEFVDFLRGRYRRVSGH